MALTKVTKSGITDNAIDADKIEDGTIVAADIADGTITAAKLDSTLNLSSKTVTLPNTSVSNAMLAGSIANDKLANSSITVNGNSVSLGGSVSAGKVQWQSVVVSDGSTVTTMVAGRGYFVNNTSAAGLVKLPTSASAGDTIAIKDYAGNFGTNSLTIQRNSHNIQGVANDSLISTNRASIVLVYIDATKGWLYTNESNVADLEARAYISATGGTVTTSGDFKIHTFTGDGCFVVSTAGLGPAALTKVDYLVVAGGGAGGSGSTGGGGGAGGYREGKQACGSPHTASPLAATTGLTVSATTYPVTVGAGGNSGSSGPEDNNTTGGNSGSPSIFSTITSAGGGRGASSNPGVPNAINLAGGSGGGNNGEFPASGAGNTPPVSPPQGSTSGNNINGSPQGIGAGGGGAISSITASPWTGGEGTTTCISASPSGYAGGGGGGKNSTTPIPAHSNPLGGGYGGPGGGGGGASGPNQGGAGGTNQGGGGGGGGRQVSVTSREGGNGGSGKVVIRYKFQN